MTEKVHASPTKQFFISMITKDIALEACILDLLDNSLDGARQQLQAAQNGKSQHTKASAYKGYSISVDFNKEEFQITDDCGGITVNNAVNYAFHFGKRKDAAQGPDFSIGLYGIGMKRAIFKIGRQIVVRSSTDTEAFEVPIDVEEWASRPPVKTDAGEFEDWDFELNRIDVTSPGTAIKITELNPDMATQLADPTFTNDLVKTIARDYSLFLQQGMSIRVNKSDVKPYPYALLEGDEFAPINTKYVDEGVTVEIIAGTSKVPPDDDTADLPYNPEVEYYGWFVACNERIVLAGDKTQKTVWGDETAKFPTWHPQYNGFMGLVKFSAANPSLLPWTTTKQDVDPTVGVYRRAVVHMQAPTRKYIDYTNARKSDPEGARALELKATAQPLAAIKPHSVIRVPNLTNVGKTKLATINYTVRLSAFNEVATSLGDGGMTRREVGLKTFEYYKVREVTDS